MTANRNCVLHDSHVEYQLRKQNELPSIRKLEIGAIDLQTGGKCRLTNSLEGVTYFVKLWGPSP